MIEPFRIDIPQADLDDLADRLSRTRWPNEVTDAGWDYGFPLARLKELAEYWRTGYDWRAHEARLNELPHFTTEIDGQNIHFVHVRSANPDALALVLTHGWPGSFLEFVDVIEPLSRDFHLVIPSIPGFAFSGPTHERGWDVARVARAWAELMRRLGYEPRSAGSRPSTSSGCTSTTCRPGRTPRSRCPRRTRPGWPRSGSSWRTVPRTRPCRRSRRRPSATR
jgi:hypothetical protein